MEELNFVAIDVETADSSRPESICQIGLAVVRGGRVVETFASAVHTPHPFGWWQKSNLSLTEDEVASAQPFNEIIRSISHLMAGPVFSHTSYDKFAIGRACNLCNFNLSDTIWLDSAQVVRRSWPTKYGKSGYGLKNVASDFGIEFLHHDAGEDARVVAEIVIRACAEHSLDPAGWAKRIKQPISTGSSQRSTVRRDGNIDGPLYGEVVVFTGGFDLPKSEQADLAAFAGCEVAAGVTKKTTLVVVGDGRFARGERSGKWRKAEDLAKQGSSLRIMSETDFRTIIAD